MIVFSPNISLVYDIFLSTSFNELNQSFINHTEQKKVDIKASLHHRTFMVIIEYKWLGEGYQERSHTKSKGKEVYSCSFSWIQHHF